MNRVPFGEQKLEQFYRTSGLALDESSGDLSPFLVGQPNHTSFSVAHGHACQTFSHSAGQKISRAPIMMPIIRNRRPTMKAELGTAATFASSP
jgi:hypothetical protein